METQIFPPSTPGQMIATSDGHHGHHRGGWEDGVILREELAGFRTAAQNHVDSSKQISDAATATVVGFKDSLAIAYQVEGRALLEAAKNANAVSVQNTANFNALMVEATKNASAAELRAQQIAATAAAQAAECCCELKALVLAQGEATRSAFSASEMQRLRDQVQALQLQNSSLFARNVAPIAPVV